MKKNYLILILCSTICILSCKKNKCVPTPPENNFNYKNGLVLHYNFNGNTLDQSGNNNNGTTNNTSLGEDRFGIAGKAYVFNGINSSVVAKNTNGTKNNTFTYAVWLKIPVIPLATTASHILELGSSPSTFGHGVSVNNYYSGSIGIRVTSNQTGLPFGFETNKLPLTERWYHVTVVRNASEVILYENGLAVHKKALPVNASAFYDNNVSLYVGSRTETEGNRQYFNGVIDDLKLYNKALSAEEVFSLYNVKD